MVWIPESPRWLIKRTREEDAARSLGHLLALPLDDPIVQAELNEIRLNLKMEKEFGDCGYLDCFKSSKNRIGMGFPHALKLDLTRRSFANPHWYIPSGMAAADRDQVCPFINC